MTLLGFVVTGALDGVHLGMSRKEVEQQWGPPAALSESLPTIARYGNAEVTYKEDRVVLLAVDVEEDPHSGGTGQADVPVGRSDFEARLRSLSVSIEPIPALTFESQEGLAVSQSGVVAVFRNGRLATIQVAARHAG